MLTPECATRQWREIPDWKAAKELPSEPNEQRQPSHSWLKNTECTHTELVTQQLFLLFLFFFNTGKTQWKWHLKSQNSFLWDKVLAHIFKLDNQTTNKSKLFRFCTHQKWRSDSESRTWRSCSDGEMDAKDALYTTTPFIPPSIMLPSSPTASTPPPLLCLVSLFSNHSW